MSSFALVDTLMVSRLGDIPLAAVGMAGQVNWLMSMLLFGFCSGSSIFISQYWGIKDIKNINRVFGLLTSFTLGISAIFFCIARFAPGAVLGMFSDDTTVTSEGMKYLLVACFAYPATALTQAFSTLLRSTENVKLPMYVTLFATILNAVLNYGLIFGKFGMPEMGVAGAALATCISAWFSPVAILLISLLSKNMLRIPIREAFSFNRELFSEYIRKCTPVTLNEGMWGLGTLLYNVIFGRLGYEYYAAVTMYRTIEGISFVFFVGLCNACCILVGKSIGAGRIDEAVTNARRFAFIVPLLSLLVGVTVILLRAPIIGLFDMSGTISELTRNAVYGILFVYGAELFFRNIPYIQIVGIFRSGGDIYSGMRYDILCVWLISLPLTALSAFVLKLPFVAVFAVMLLAEDSLKALLCIRRFRSRKWIQPVTDEGRRALANQN